jgi:hypothetical protein
MTMTLFVNFILPVTLRAVSCKSSCAKIKNGLPSRYVINEVCALVCHQGQWVTKCKLGQDIFVNKFGNTYHHIVGPQALHFDPLSGIVNKHKDIFVVGMPPNWFNRANEIQALFHEWIYV